MSEILLAENYLKYINIIQILDNKLKRIITKLPATKPQSYIQYSFIKHNLSLT